MTKADGQFNKIAYDSKVVKEVGCGKVAAVHMLAKKIKTIFQM
jgi:hypothetical protein